MTNRVTMKDLNHALERINRAVGFDPATVEYSTVGAYRLGGAYGGVRLERVVNEAGGIESLYQYAPKRELLAFLDGFYAALLRH